jgi:hypothetical protein
MVSVRRVAPILLLLIALPSFGAKPKASSHPPKELHRVGDHWTAYNPPDPATYPPTAKTYTIKTGDTLWHLGNQFYGNAYLWPQLWESNTWITDAHWIYPGDVLLVEGEAGNANVATNTTASSNLTGGAPNTASSNTSGPSTALAAVTAAGPVALGFESDLYCWGYLGDPNEPMPNRLDSFEDTEVMYQPGVVDQSMSARDGDVVFIKGGTSTGLAAGETYLLVVPGEIIAHPVTKATIGRHYDYVGQIRILCADANRATGLITQACRDVNLSARLKPMPQLPIPIARVPSLPTICDAPTNQRPGFIVNSKGFESILGTGDLVEINLGAQEQIQPGDFLTVYRDPQLPGQPREVVGEVGVLTTESHTATARIVEMRRSMQVGDKLEMR